MPRSPNAATRQPNVPDESERTARAVAAFYDEIVFPSRVAHPDYVKLLPTAPGERVGDFGCGQSLFHDALRSYRPSPVFVDSSLRSLRTIEYGYRVRADLRHLPFEDAVYDRILCIGVLHHLPERLPAFREMARVLRAGGLLILGVYLPGTLQSRLRRLHETCAFRPWRRILMKGTEVLIRARYRGAGQALDAGDARRRARDLLEVPYVRYQSPEEYVRQAEACGLRARGASRIASMSILHFGKE